MYVCLQEELFKLDKLEEHLQTDNNQINERIKGIDEKMEQFENINDLKADKEQKRQVRLRSSLRRAYIDCNDDYIVSMV